MYFFKKKHGFKFLFLLGWNHRGVYILARDKIFKSKIKRKLSTDAHRRMRMDYHRQEKKYFLISHNSFLKYLINIYF